MDIVFTYGSRKSAVTPKTILFGDLRVYVPNKVYEVENYIGSLPSNPLHAISLLEAGDSAKIIATIQAIKDYLPKAVAWYDQRVSRNTGGKQQNYRDNRAAVSDGLNKALEILTRGLLDLQNKKVASVTSSLPTLPDGTPNPDAAVSPISKLILPIGAGLAALFFLKGH